MSEQGNDEQDRGQRPVLTNRQGHPVSDNQNNRTVGDRGPTVLENYQFPEKISHFDRERIPERVVHARGADAHGYSEAYGRFPLLPVGRLLLDRNPVNYFAEVEQVAFGTGVLVDGLDFSDDKLMAYHVDGVEAGENPRTSKAHTPFVSGNVVRQKTGRQNNYGQAGARYRAMEDGERDELVSSLVNLVGQCDRDIQERMVSHLSQCDEEYGSRVAQGLGIEVGARPTADTVGAR